MNVARAKALSFYARTNAKWPALKYGDFTLARVFLASLSVYVFRWSAHLHRAARLSRYRAVKAGHPRSGIGQENDSRTGPIGITFA